MARIIYKEGFEGQNRLEYIEGIEIELLNGYKALVFPKYKGLPLLDEDKIESWKASKLTEIQALKVIDGKALTDELLELGSPAAKFVRQFKSNKHEDFDLPTLLAAGEIMDQKRDIDALSETIGGADLLRDISSYLWSCCRGSSGGAWGAGGLFRVLRRRRRLVRRVVGRACLALSLILNFGRSASPRPALKQKNHGRNSRKGRISLEVQAFQLRELHEALRLVWRITHPHGMRRKLPPDEKLRQEAQERAGGAAGPPDQFRRFDM